MMDCCHSPSQWRAQHIDTTHWTSRERPTPIKHEAVHADLFIPRNTDSIDQFIAQSAQRCHEPAVAGRALLNITGRRAVNEELRLFKDILVPTNSATDPLNKARHNPIE